MLFSNMVKCFTAKCECLHLIIAKTPYSSKILSLLWFQSQFIDDLETMMLLAVSSLCNFLCVQCSCDFEDELTLVSVIPVEFLGTWDVVLLWILSVLMSCQQPWKGCPCGLHGDRKNWGKGMNLLSCFLYSAVLMIYGLNWIIATAYPTPLHSFMSFMETFF